MKIKKITLVVSMLFIACLNSVQALAHHSMAEFDHENQLELTGEVIEWQFINPHSWLIVYVENENGELVEWAFESTSPSVLRNRGYTRKTFQEGDMVTVRVSPRKDGNPEGGLSRILLINGQEFVENTN